MGKDAFFWNDEKEKEDINIVILLNFNYIGYYKNINNQNNDSNNNNLSNIDNYNEIYYINNGKE